MPHLTELSAEWQNKLNRDVVGHIPVEVILDPDDLNINISSYIDGSGNIRISKRKSILPYGSLGQYTAGEITLPLISEGDIFNHNNPDKTFYHTTSRLYAVKLAANNYIDIPKGDGSKFRVGQKVYINENTFGHIVASIDETTYTNYDRIIFGAPPIVMAYPAGAWVELAYLPGRKLTLKNYMAGVSTKISQFVGFLRSYPKLSKDKTEMVILDNFRLLLEVNIKANDYRILTDSIGNYNDTTEHIRANEEDPSDGTLNLAPATFNTSKCKIGNWKIKFISSVDFICTDPDGIEYTGKSTQHFYAGTVLDYQISMPIGCWSGSWDLDDEIDFQTVLSLGMPTNAYKSIPQMIFRLLVEEFGADLSSSEIDYASFTSLILDYDEMRGAISFTQPTTVLKCLEILQQHINATVFLNNDGLFSIAVYRPKLHPDEINVLSPAADIREVDQEDLGRIDRIWAYYNFNHETGQYGGLIMVPEGADEAGNKLEINFPAYHATDYGQAKASAERIYLMWRRGVKPYEIKEKFNHGIAFDLNEIYQINSLHPEFGDKIVEIYELQKDVLKKEITLKAYDIDFVFGNYGFSDVHYCDRGYVCW